jgi:hypothetical protein
MMMQQKEMLYNNHGKKEYYFSAFSTIFKHSGYGSGKVNTKLKRMTGQFCSIFFKRILFAETTEDYNKCVAIMRTN